MNEDTAQRRRIWPVVCASLSLLLPVLYVASSGPVLKLAVARPAVEAIAIRAYRPLLDFAETREQSFLRSYLSWWRPAGIVSLIYAPDGRIRAVLTYLRSDTRAETPLTDEEFSDEMGQRLVSKLADDRAAYERMAAAKPDSHSHPSDELTEFMESPTAREITRKLRSESLDDL